MPILNRILVEGRSLTVPTCASLGTARVGVHRRLASDLLVALRGPQRLLGPNTKRHLMTRSDSGRPRTGRVLVRPTYCRPQPNDPDPRSCRAFWDTEGGPRPDISRVLCPSRDGDHLSWTPVARRLERPIPEGSASSLIPDGTPSYLVLLRAGFAWPAGRPAAGGLLPHHFTLTRVPL